MRLPKHLFNIGHPFGRLDLNTGVITLPKSAFVGSRGNATREGGYFSPPHHGYHARGAEAYFFRIKHPEYGRVGLKVYRESASARHAFELQRQFHAEGFAPEVFGQNCVRVRIERSTTHGDGSDGYKVALGFYSEIVKVVDYEHPSADAYTLELRDLARGLGFRVYNDIRPQNIGLNSKGVPVVLDFGPVTVRENCTRDARLFADPL